MQACQDMRQWDLDLPEWGLTLAPKPTALNIPTHQLAPFPPQLTCPWLAAHFDPPPELPRANFNNIITFTSSSTTWLNSRRPRGQHLPPFLPLAPQPTNRTQQTPPKTGADCMLSLLLTIRHGLGPPRRSSTPSNRQWPPSTPSKCTRS